MSGTEPPTEDTHAARLAEIDRELDALQAECERLEYRFQARLCRVWSPATIRANRSSADVSVRQPSMIWHRSQIDIGPYAERLENRRDWFTARGHGAELRAEKCRLRLASDDLNPRQRNSLEHARSCDESDAAACRREAVRLNAERESLEPVLAAGDRVWLD